VTAPKKYAGKPEGARVKRGLLYHYNETAGHRVQRRDGESGYYLPLNVAVLLPSVSVLKALASV